MNTRLRAERGLKVEVVTRGRWPLAGERAAINGKGAAPGDEPGGAARREKPLDVENPGRGREP